ncbi:plasmid partitioning/stability family protein [Escherichia coli]|uniref:plasmid partitioning/stability family protein n=1 Tax=Escherichia coli TaxID=562 RepID=UPI003F4EA4B7
MTTPTRRISFYLKPVAVKNESEACAWLDSLTPEARKSGQRVAFLAGLALLKMNPAEAYRLAAWADDEALSVTQKQDDLNSLDELQTLAIDVDYLEPGNGPDGDIEHHTEITLPS